jgi:hypothetical protein
VGGRLLGFIVPVAIVVIVDGFLLSHVFFPESYFPYGSDEEKQEE